VVKNIGLNVMLIQSCKIWLQPVALARNPGFCAKELRDIEKIIIEIQPHFERIS
jgi:hypothetical protein